MTSFYVVVGIVLLCGLSIWIAVANARKQGAANQAALDAQRAKDAEAAIHQVQAENRDTADTKDRLDKGTF